MDDNITAAVLGMSLFFAIAWVIAVISNNLRRRKVAEVRKEMQVKLLEKFGGTEDLVAYLNSEAGQRFLESVTLEQTRPMSRILHSLQVGINLFLVGAALLFLRGRLPADWTTDTLVFGTLAVALGIGFLLSAASSYWLSRNWGLFEQKQARGLR